MVKIITLIYINKLLYYIDLLLFPNLLELLVINHSSSERRNIFFHWWLKLSCFLVVLQLAWVHTFLQLGWITRSGLELNLALQRVSGYLWHSFIWFCQFSHISQYISGLEVLTYSIDINFNNVITMLQRYVHP